MKSDRDRTLARVGPAFQAGRRGHPERVPLHEGFSAVLKRALAVALLAIATATTAVAQEASLVGTVTDETKAVLPGVTVTATNIATGVQMASTLR